MISGVGFSNPKCRIMNFFIVFSSLCEASGGIDPEIHRPVNADQNNLDGPLS